MEKKRSKGITIFGWGIIALSLLSSFLLFKTFPYQKGLSLYLHVIYIAFLLIVGIGTLKLRRWARISLFCLVVIKIIDLSFRAIPYLLKSHTKIIGLVDIISALVPSILVLWFFTRPKVKEQFK